ncbi:MAG: mannose-1-phosphate guanylyltransferase [Candidatus Nanohaloarchaea archaeon]|jgi:mannose-1-phosphate guanylyltransferase
MAKKRVSLTLDEGVVEKVDHEADRRDLNRSQMVEDIIEQYFRQEGLETAVVLCGDEEARTLELYEGKPVLSHILDNLSEEGFSRVVLLAGQNHVIEDNFGSDYNGLALEYIFEENPQGNAVALRKVEDKIRDDFAVLNGHVIADVDFQDMLTVHREENALATIALTAVEEPTNYGVAELKGRKILGFEEKPEEGEEPSRLINAGAYIFSPEVFSELDEDSLESAFSRFASESKLYGYIYGGEWKDIDE